MGHAFAKPVVAVLTWLVGSGALLQACASTAAGAPGESRRMQLNTVQDWPVLAPLMARLGEVAGMPLRDAVLLSPRQVKFTLVCADTPACDSAAERLSDATALVAGIEPDLKRKLPTRPLPSSPSAR